MPVSLATWQDEKGARGLLGGRGRAEGGGGPVRPLPAPPCPGAPPCPPPLSSPPPSDPPTPTPSPPPHLSEGRRRHAVALTDEVERVPHVLGWGGLLSRHTAEPQKPAGAAAPPRRAAVEPPDPPPPLSCCPAYLTPPPPATPTPTLLRHHLDLPRAALHIGLVQQLHGGRPPGGRRGLNRRRACREAAAGGGAAPSRRPRLRRPWAARGARARPLQGRRADGAGRRPQQHGDPIQARADEQRGGDCAGGGGGPGHARGARGGGLARDGGARHAAVRRVLRAVALVPRSGAARGALGALLRRRRVVVGAVQRAARAELVFRAGARGPGAMGGGGGA
jgi:hypothetical protein